MQGLISQQIFAHTIFVPCNRVEDQNVKIAMKGYHETMGVSNRNRQSKRMTLSYSKLDWIFCN